MKTSSAPFGVLLRATTILAIASLSGCNTIGDAQSARGSGSVRVYQAPFDAVWAASVQAVEQSNLDLLSANEPAGEILAQKGISAFSYGENVAIYVEAVVSPDVAPTQVEIVSKKSMSTNIFARNWSGSLHQSIREKLAAEGSIP